MEEKLKQMRRRSNDLSDIVLEKDSKKTENTKKWLLTAASMILLFLIILIVMKMLNKPDGAMDENIASVGESVETLAADDMQEAPEDDLQENLFKKEPIIDETSETDLKFEEMVRKLKEQDKVEEPVVEKVVKVEKEAAPVVKPLVEQPVVQEVKPREIKPVVEVVERELPVRKTVPYEPAPYQEPVVQKVTPKKPAAPKYSQATAIPSISGYFIQVGATAKSFPDKRFLTKIKRAGFDYIVHGVTIKGKHIKKVLVGPYSTRDAAKEALRGVKANINPSAYIYRIK
jgi:DedD protein